MKKKYEYYDDLPPRNHPDYMQKWREKNRPYLSKKWKVWYDSATLEEKKEYYRKRYAKKSKEQKQKEYLYKREWQWKNRFGIKNLTWQLYEETLKKQKNKCKICKEDMKNPHADHDHKTGYFRALLCAGCNLAYGRFEKFKKEFINYDIRTNTTN